MLTMFTRLVVVVLLMTVQVMARGGGRSSGGSYSSGGSSYSSSYGRSYSRNYGYSGGSSSNGPMPGWAIGVCVGLVVFVLLLMCCMFSMSDDQCGVEKSGGGGYNRTISYQGTIECYLCLHKVLNREWDSGEHRRKCAFQRQRELLGFPQPYEAYCKNCNEQLRLWPAKGHPYYCDQCPLDQCMVLKRSTGHNRLNCFLCDFDCCVNCAMDGKAPKRFLRTQGAQNRWQTTVEEVDENEPQPIISPTWQLVNGQWKKVSVSQPRPTQPAYNPSHHKAAYNEDLPPAYPADQYSSSAPLINSTPSSLPYAIQPDTAHPAPSAPPLFTNQFLTS